MEVARDDAPAGGLGSALRSRLIAQRSNVDEIAVRSITSRVTASSSIISTRGPVGPAMIGAFLRSRMRRRAFWRRVAADVS
jgi:hypothetical protein